MMDPLVGTTLGIGVDENTALVIYNAGNKASQTGEVIKPRSNINNIRDTQKRQNKLGLCNFILSSEDNIAFCIKCLTCLMKLDLGPKGLTHQKHITMLLWVRLIWVSQNRCV